MTRTESFAHDADLEQLVQRDITAHGTLSCVLVDEAQFLEPAQVDDLLRIAVLEGVPVMAYGIRTDYRDHQAYAAFAQQAFAEEKAIVQGIGLD